MRIEKYKAVKEYITKDVLIKYLIAHNMTWVGLSRMLGIGVGTLREHAKSLNFNLQEEKENYAVNHYKKVMNNKSEMRTIKYIKSKKPLAIIK